MLLQIVSILLSANNLYNKLIYRKQYKIQYDSLDQWRFFGSQTVDTDHVYPNVIQLNTGYAINATLAHKGFVVVASVNATGIHFTISKVQGISTATTNPTVQTINIGY